MINVKCILIAGCPGARSDFVAGWLGTLDNFVDNRWEIHPLTGMSSGHQRITKILDKPDHVTLEDRLAQNDMQLDATSELTFAGSVHGYKFYVVGNDTRLPWKNYDKTFKILYIRVPDDNQEIMDKIRWEFFCKSYLSKQYDWADLMNDPNLDILKFSEQEFSTFHEFSNFGIPRSKSIDYTKLFTPGGSVHLCDILGITASAENHAAWDEALPKADSPEEVAQFGKSWRKADHITAIRS